MKKIALLILLFLIGLLLLSLLTKKGSIVFMKYSLKRTVEKSLDGADGKFAVYIKNLKTGESYWQLENEVFEAGSLYKLWVMGKVLQQIKAGDLKRDDSVEVDTAEINNQYGI